MEQRAQVLLTFRTDSIAACRVISSDYFLANKASLDVLTIGIMVELFLDVVRFLKSLFFRERAIDNTALSIWVVHEWIIFACFWVLELVNNGSTPFQLFTSFSILILQFSWFLELLFVCRYLASALLNFNLTLLQ